MEGRDPSLRHTPKPKIRIAKDGTIHGVDRADFDATLSKELSTGLKTNPLFAPLPVYGPPSGLRILQYYILRLCAAVLSLHFLIGIVLGAIVTSIPAALAHCFLRLRGRNPSEKRVFYQKELEKQRARNEEEKAWVDRSVQTGSTVVASDKNLPSTSNEYIPSEGGPDKLVNDIRYYARRVGLDMEEFRVHTEDGFILRLWHVYDPQESTPTNISQRKAKSPQIPPSREMLASQFPDERKRFQVLLVHGLLQSAGAFCCTDDNSLAFYLAKSGYDVWLGNNRCGFQPEHAVLDYNDPRMWAWDIRQMGVMDLPALVDRVLEETGSDKLGLVCHSQGTTETLVALAKEQRPDIGEKVSVFCGLAPAAYAGPLLKKAYFKFMRLISPDAFRLVFGIHSFIPFMLAMHNMLPSKFYGTMGYLVFSFLFDWSDQRWDRGLRNRLFQFSPTYVSSESMCWWLGREGFAKQKCILATRDEGKIGDEEDAEEDENYEDYDSDTQEIAATIRHKAHHHADEDRGKYAWFDDRAPPFAFWVAGSDQLVDGRRLLRRFERGREPYVDLVHAKIIKDYEHLDVIWAMNSIEMVGSEVKEVIWKTASPEARAKCRTPEGCENVEFWTGPRHGNASTASTSNQRTASSTTIS